MMFLIYTDKKKDICCYIYIILSLQYSFITVVDCDKI